MLRSVCAIVVVLAFSGCGRREDADQRAYSAAYAPAPAAARIANNMAADKKAEPDGPKLAYTHNMSLETKAEAVTPRFEQVRDACLSGTISGCVLLQANIQEVGYDGGRHPTATLSVRLTHDAVAPFEQAVTKPLPGEEAGDVSVTSRSTSAEDLTAAILDDDRRLSQLSDYRDRLAQLAKRADAKMDDLIRVESEISTTQSQIEELTAEQHRLNQRVATEVETVEITGRVGVVGKGSDVAEVWHRAGRLLDSSLADALGFLITAVPWIAGFLLVLILLPIMRIVGRTFWRIGRPRRPA